jgi:hypothetical protein
MLSTLCSVEVSACRDLTTHERRPSVFGVASGGFSLVRLHQRRSFLSEREDFCLQEASGSEGYAQRIAAAKLEGFFG